ncbi:conserved hypothetical protein [Pseudomonas sp. OF001]|uniref:primase-helicase family protein n=1 Tax=Pseudomonas sp. OF001 TaxID=2772300 RepID=UPI00191A0920|nr:primase-helicase family protein [Pseudomonas sp. OF001]CAD5377429.1 conserved hypothetical protein [Pseudomonas sp. OF001]
MNILPTSIPTLLKISSEFILAPASGGGTCAYHIASGDVMGKEMFIQFCTGKYGEVALVDAEGGQRRMSSGACWWLWSDASKRAVRRVVMHPTKADEGDDDRDVFNLWHVRKLEMAQPDMSATLDSIRPLIDHLMFVSDNDKEGVMFTLNWMAWLWREPGYKIPSAIMMYSRFGRVGKSMIAELLARVFGPSLVKSVDGLRLHDKFMDSFEHKRIAVLNELARSDKMDGYERFKSLVSERRMDFEGKGKAAKEVENHLHFILTTNNADALPLMENDGRILVLRCESHPREPAYYRQLAQWIEGPGPALVAGAFAQWVFPADWDASAPVPQTAACRMTQRDAKGALFAFISELVEQGRAPFDRDMGRVEALVEQLATLYPANFGTLKPNHKTLPKVLQDLGAVKISSGNTTAGWCWRHQDMWLEFIATDKAGFTSCQKYAKGERDRPFLVPAAAKLAGGAA